jgi:hypothetical protein
MDRDDAEMMKVLKDEIVSLNKKVAELTKTQEKAKKDNPSITKAEILAEPDYHKRQKLIEENFELFNNGKGC